MLINFRLLMRLFFNVLGALRLPVVSFGWVIMEYKCADTQITSLFMQIIFVCRAIPASTDIEAAEIHGVRWNTKSNLFNYGSCSSLYI